MKSEFCVRKAKIMNETILINHYLKEQGRLSNFFNKLEVSNNIQLSTVQTRGDVIKITLKKACNINPLLIKDCELTCVVENELFRTVYVDGNRVMWDSIHS